MDTSVMSAEQLSVRLTAIASEQRMRILANLAGERLHVSELARRVGMSRALLYMHLTKLEEAGFVTGRLELSDDGKALKIFEVVPFTLTVDAETLVSAVTRSAERAEPERMDPESTEPRSTEPEQRTESGDN